MKPQIERAVHRLMRERGCDFFEACGLLSKRGLRKRKDRLVAKRQREAVTSAHWRRLEREGLA